MMFFLCGGLGYVGLELLWRGRSHYSMFFAGGLCTLLLCTLYMKYRLPWWAAGIWGGCVISAVELVTGYVFNIRLRRGVWDYGRMPFNLQGQVCLPYALLWCVLSLGLWGYIRSMGLS